MGINMLGKISLSVFDNKESKIKRNPNPNNYVIKKCASSHGSIDFFTIVEINYPDCENFEGNKILVFKNVSIEQLEKQKVIDPHFSDNDKYFSPIARFVPTQEGWENADMFCMAYADPKIRDFMDWKYRRDEWEKKFKKNA